MGREPDRVAVGTLQWRAASGGSGTKRQHEGERTGTSLAARAESCLRRCRPARIAATSERNVRAELARDLAEHFVGVAKVSLVAFVKADQAHTRHDASCRARMLRR